jgi:transposase-like protein
VAPRVSPTEAIRARIHELFAGDVDLPSALEQVARLSVQLTFQTVLEEIVCEELGRARYERRTEDAPAGSRNGHQPPRTIKTTLGPVEVRRPKLRGTTAPLVDQLFGSGVARTNALETLVVSCWVRGLSDRDIEAMLAETFGDAAAVSKSTASRICSRLKDEFDAWRRRDLSGACIDYLFLDGSFFKMHPQAKAEPVLAAWGIDTDGKPVFLGLSAGSTESTDAWRGFLDDLVGRGLRAPLLVIADGGPGLLAAIEIYFPRSLLQRWLIHRAENVLATVSKADQGDVKRDYWAVFDRIEEPAGHRALAEGRRRAKAFCAKWRKRYPSAVECVEQDLDALLNHLRFPIEHRKRIRHSNLIERTFGETRRRVKVIGRLPGERSCLSLVWAVLDRQSKGWRGLTMTPRALRHLQDLRRELLHDHPSNEAPDERVTAAA